MKFSLVIPTKNRLPTLRHSLASALATRDKNLEIVVSDNQSTDGTSEFLAGLDDPRLKVLTTPSPLSMRANFEFSLDHCSGDWVIYIGDDDGVTRHGIGALTDIVKASGADAVSWTPIPYLWPDTASTPYSTSGLRMRNFSGIYETADHEALFASFLDGTIHNYLEGAKIYHGAVSRKVIDRVRNAAGGQYFGAMSPDVFVSISNLRFVERFVKSPCAVTISGKSSNSNGWANLKASGDREKAEKFFDDERNSAVPDPKSPVDLRIRSVRCHDLDALLLANEAIFDGKLDIDYGRWIDNIARTLNTRDDAEHADSIARLRDLAAALGVERPDFPDPPPRRAPTPDRPMVKRRLTRVRAVTSAFQTVEELAAAIDPGPGRGRSRHLPGVFSDWRRVVNRYVKAARG